MRIPGFSFWALVTALILYLLLTAIGMEKITSIIFAVIWYLCGAGSAYAVMKFHRPPSMIHLPGEGVTPEGVCTVSFSNQGKTAYVPAGGNLRAAAMAQGVEIHYDINKYVNCFGLGHCGTCRFNPDPKAPGALSEPTWQERFTLGDDVGKIRLSCQSAVLDNCTVSNTVAQDFGKIRYYAVINGALIGVFSLLMLGVILWMGGDMIGIF